MSEGNAWYPPDVTALAPAIFEVARRIVAAETTPGATYSNERTEPPMLEATPAYLQIISGAELDSASSLVFRILVAAELDRNVHRVVRRMSALPEAVGTPVDGVVTIVEGLGEDPVAALRALWPGSQLLARGVVTVLDPSLPPISQQVTVPTRILDHLVTGEASSPAAPFSIEPPVPMDSLCPVPVRGRTDIDAAGLVHRLLGSMSRRAPLWLVGAPGSGRRTLLASVANALGKRLMCVSQSSLGALGATAVAAMWRELLLNDGIICVHDAEPFVESGSPEQTVRSAAIDQAFVSFVGALVASRLPVVFTSSQPPPLQAFDHPLQVVQLEPALAEDTLVLWQLGLPEVPDVVDLATRFRLPPGRIVRAIAAARTQHQANATGAPLSSADVSRAISMGVAQHVSVLGTRIEDSQKWEDIILPTDTKESVDEMVARVRHRHHVLEEWGFRGKLSKGLGVAALFHGPPGTGKTMVASLIARELGQELYQVDLSRMVSKWIGETEKNLAKVFDAADGANVMLLFDEADSLFSKRTAVSSSNDRYANAEVNYLLQRVERFEGVCILTTNFERSIDTAFKRRLAFRIEFPMPNEKERTELWRRMVPRSANITRDVDYGLLAKSYELAGGNIRNALLRAAFLAADRGEPITMATLQTAVKLEYRDAGKLAASGAIS